jgi:hypothetical protein
MLAMRASTWPRDHFCRKRDCPTPIEADDVKRSLANVDADHGDHTL